MMIQQPINQPRNPYKIKPLTQEEIEEIIQLLDNWMADESGYEEQSWDELKSAIDQEREYIGARRLFSE